VKLYVLYAAMSYVLYCMNITMMIEDLGTIIALKLKKKTISKI